MKFDEEEFKARYGLIERIIESTARHRLTASETEEFRSRVLFKLVANDFEKLREFRGSSSLRTFLTSVIQNERKDYCNQLWGKWRPSAEAKRQGPIAILLEQLMYRDRYTFGEASEILRTNYRIEISDKELEDLCAKLPVRVRRREVDETESATVASDGLDPEAAAIQSEDQEKGKRLLEALDRALADLDAQDRLIIQLRFWQSMTVAQIGRAMTLEQAPLYPRINKLLAKLRKCLIENGFDADIVDGCLADAEVPEEADTKGKEEKKKDSDKDRDQDGDDKDEAGPAGGIDGEGPSL